MSNSELLVKVKELLDKDKAPEAKSLFVRINPDDSVEYYLVKGKLEQKFQNWGEAINAYSKVLELDSGNLEAANNLNLIEDILNYWNTDMFNP
ncbi:MAG: hypothetical protein ABFS16_14550 [Bacteroidota bacterium]